MIVAAALPLVTQHGTAVTTAQIARAAGIGEATIFRVFEDKNEVLAACVAEAVSPDHILRELAAIPLDAPLAIRLVEAADALRAHLERMGAVLGTLHATGYCGPRARGDHGPAPDRRIASARALRRAIAELIEPDRDRLRLSPETVAAIFLGLAFAQPRAPFGSDPDGDETPSPADLVDVLLNGALAERDPATVAALAAAGDGKRDEG